METDEDPLDSFYSNTNLRRWNSSPMINNNGEADSVYSTERPRRSGRTRTFSASMYYRLADSDSGLTNTITVSSQCNLSDAVIHTFTQISSSNFVLVSSSLFCKCPESCCYNFVVVEQKKKQRTGRLDRQGKFRYKQSWKFFNLFCKSKRLGKSCAKIKKTLPKDFSLLRRIRNSLKYF